MRLLGPPCATGRGGTAARLHRSAVLPLLLVLCSALSSRGCPESCLCSAQTVKCQNQLLKTIPQSLPANTKVLFITGNSISHIGPYSFPARLDQLTDLFLSGNELEYVNARAFENLPNLHRLDLSNNRLRNISNGVFSGDTQLQLLNLSSSFSNSSSMGALLNFLRSGNLLRLTSLDLSNNNLVILPASVLANLSSLSSLHLQNSSIITILNGTLKVPPLRELDLRDNSLRDLTAVMQAELALKPSLRVWLAGNPWRCDCFIEETLAWLRNSTQVVDMQNLTCAEPKALKRQLLLHLETTRLKCSSDLEGVLETSYVFLGLVLALIGVIFLLVLYLNRKGIKRWMYNIRDACRDHMEGYHYRYEINSDPRLANLSINSDV